VNSFSFMVDPPKSFNATTAFLLPRRRGVETSSPASVQGHHGVPASEELERELEWMEQFQCHHGVPASLIPSTDILGVQVRFNATTAFLLPLSPEPSWAIRPPCFNATTAFLLRSHRPAAPQRPPGFQCHHGVPASGSTTVEKKRSPCFNATTAFLLLAWEFLTRAVA
jgi:hypothetical protein